MTTEASDTDDEDGEKKKLEEHTAEIDVQGDDGHW